MGFFSGVLSNATGFLDKVSGEEMDKAKAEANALKKALAETYGTLTEEQEEVVKTAIESYQKAKEKIENLEDELKNLEEIKTDLSDEIKDAFSMTDKELNALSKAHKNGDLDLGSQKMALNEFQDELDKAQQDFQEKNLTYIDALTAGNFTEEELAKLEMERDAAEALVDYYGKQVEATKDTIDALQKFEYTLNDIIPKLEELGDVEEDEAKAKKSLPKAKTDLKNAEKKGNKALQKAGVKGDVKSGAEAAEAAKGAAKGGGSNAAAFKDALKSLGIAAMVADVLISAIEWGIGKATEYMMANYKNTIKMLETEMTVSLNNMRVGLASWKNSIQGAYEAQSLSNESTIAMLDAQNQVQLANTKLANSWWKWVPIYGKVLEYQEQEMELQMQLAQMELQNYAKRIEQVRKYTEQTDEFIKKFDKTIRAFQAAQGLTADQYESFKNRMIDMNGAIAEYGTTVDEVLKVQKQFNEQSGRLKNMSNLDYEHLAASIQLFGSEAVANFSAQMEIFNHSVSDSAEIMYDMYKDANKMGISQAKLVKNVLSNLKLANKYDFKNGTKGFIELAKWAENVRFNIGSIGGALEKVQSGGIEGIITSAAKLQVLGGDFARMSNPLEMMFEGFNSPEDYAKRIQSMFENMGSFNTKTGETTFNMNEQMLMRSAAETLGMDLADVKNMARGARQYESVKKQLKGGLSEEKMREVANRAQYDEESGKWYVNTIDNGRVDVSNIGKNFDFSKIETGNTDKDMLSYAKETLNVEQQINKATQEINAMLGGGTWDDFMENVKRANEQTVQFFKDNIDNVTKGITDYRKATVDAQLDALKESVGDWANVPGIMSEMKDIAEEIRDMFEAQFNKTVTGKNEAELKMIQRRFIAGKDTTEEQRANLKNWKGRKLNAKDEERLIWEGFKNRAGKQASVDDPFFRFMPTETTPQYLVKARREYKDPKHTTVTNRSGKMSNSGVPYTSEEYGSDYNLPKYPASLEKNTKSTKDSIVSANGSPMFVQASNVTPVQDGFALSSNAIQNMTTIHDGTTQFAKTDSHDSAIFAKAGGPFDKLFNSVFNKVDEIYSYIGGGNTSRSNIYDRRNTAISNGISNIIGGNASSRNSYSNSSSVIDNALSMLSQSFSNPEALYKYSSALSSNTSNERSFNMTERMMMRAAEEGKSLSPLNGTDNVGEAVIMSSGGKSSVSSPSDVHLDISGKLELVGQNGQSIDILAILRNNPQFVRKITEMIVMQMNSNMYGGRTEPFHNRFASTG